MRLLLELSGDRRESPNDNGDQNTLSHALLGAALSPEVTAGRTGVVTRVTDTRAIPADSIQIPW